MPYRTMTDLVLVVTVVSLILYNIVVGWISGGDATISSEARRLGYKYPIIVGAVVGVVCHWWWPVGGMRD